MKPMTLCNHIEFHLLLWVGLVRVAAEGLSWYLIKDAGANTD